MEDVELMIQRPVINKENGIVINGNFEEVKKMVKAKVDKYKNLVLNEDNLKEVKDAKMVFTHLRTGIEREQKQYKALYITPMADNIDKLCEDIQKVVAEGEVVLQNQLDEYDQKRKDELTEIIRMYINQAVEDKGLVGKYAEGFEIKKSYYNKGTKEEDIIKDINEQAVILSNRQKERLQAEKRIQDACKNTSLVAEQYIQLLDYGRTAFEVLDMIDEAKEKAASFNKEMQKKAEEGEKIVLGEKQPEVKNTVEVLPRARHIYQFSMDKENEAYFVNLLMEICTKSEVDITELRIK